MIKTTKIRTQILGIILVYCMNLAYSSYTAQRVSKTRRRREISKYLSDVNGESWITSNSLPGRKNRSSYRQVWVLLVRLCIVKIPAIVRK